MKLEMILGLVLPLLSIAATALERKDANSSGADDQAARSIRAAIAALTLYQREPPQPPQREQ